MTLKELALKKNESLRSLARKTGYSYQSVVNWNCKFRSPTILEIKDLAIALDESIMKVIKCFLED